MPSLPHTQLSSQSLPLSDSEVTSARPHWRTRATRRLVSGLAIGTIFTALLLVTSFKSDVGWNGHGHLPHDELHEIDIPPAPFKGSVADITQLRPKRVAIVGAGASGSSAAFFLRRAARIMEERIGAHEGAMLGEVVVVDKEGYVGGRSTTVYPHNDKSLYPVELGASIFVSANRHLVKAAALFNLTSSPPDFGTSGVGIWNGTTMLYETSSSGGLFSGWWDAISAVFRYGPLSPYRTKNAVSALLKKFHMLYEPKFLSEQGAAMGVSEMVERVGLGREMTNVWADEWALGTVGVGEKWMGEIMEGSTRTNYASNMNQIHALGAAVSMATSGAQSIAGGNWQIFDRMLKNASATVVLGTKVTDILPFTTEEGEQRFQLRTNTTFLQDDQPFDIIIFAAPWHLSPISKSMEHYFYQDIPEQKYTHLHVTLFTTTQPRPNPRFFGLAEDAAVPGTILTSAYTSRGGVDGTDASGLPPPRFQSISWHGETGPGTGEYVVKVFSMTYLKDEFLEELAGDKPTWILRKEWDSYPRLKPVKSYAPVEPFRGFHYLAALEPWVSTMETQTLSAREAVARIVQDWWGMGYGECRGGADAWDWTCSVT